MALNPAGLVVLGVGGFCIGMLIGIALKAAARVLLYVAGLYLASLLILNNIGIIEVNWVGLANLIQEIARTLSNIARTDVLTSTGAFGVATAMGMLYGAVKATIKGGIKVGGGKYFKKL